MRTLARHPQLVSDMGNRPTLTDTTDQQHPTINSQTSISVGHEDLRCTVKTSDISTKPGGPPQHKHPPDNNVPAEYT